MYKEFGVFGHHVKSYRKSDQQIQFVSDVSGIFRPETCDRSVCDARSCCDLLSSNSLRFDVPCYKIMEIIKSGSIINERPAYLRVGNGCIPLIFLQTPCTY